MDSKEVSVAVGQLLLSDGWKYLLEEINERLDMLDREADVAVDVNIVQTCMIKRQGILYVVRTAKELADND